MKKGCFFNDSNCGCQTEDDDDDGGDEIRYIVVEAYLGSKYHEQLIIENNKSIIIT